MADERTFPDVEFVRKTAEEIQEEMVASWEASMGRILGKADPIRVMLGWEAAIDAQLYTAINESAKLNLPRYTFGDYQDSIAEIFYQGLERLKATAATTTMRFTLSKAAETDTAIPVGTQCTRDGTAVFATDETVYIPAGEIYADVGATCTETGTIGNGYAAGTITTCMDPDRVERLESVTNLTASEGGAAQEDDASFYERMRESMSAFSTAGPAKGYIYHAKSANPNVGSVLVDSPAPGCVDVYFLKAGGGVPEVELIETVQQALSDDEIRPLTDYVTVKAPEQVFFNINLTWYRERGAAESLEETQAKLERAAQEYVTWQTAEIGRDITPDRLTMKLMETGIKRIVRTEPVYTVISKYQVAALGDMTITYGGDEDA